MIVFTICMTIEISVMCQLLLAACKAKTKVLDVKSTVACKSGLLNTKKYSENPYLY